MAEPQPTTGASTSVEAAPPLDEVRRYAWLCAFLLGGHLLALILPAWCRKGFSECFFLADSGLALLYTNRARLRSAGSVRIFWTLFSAALGVFAAGTLLSLGEGPLGWVPSQVLLTISYRLYAVPLAMILFVPGEDADQREFAKEAILDFLQLGILCWLAMFVLYYLPTRSLALRDLQHYGAVDLGDKINLLLLALSYLRWKMEPSPQMRSLRGRLAVFVAFYSVVSVAGNYVDVSGKAASTAWFDPVWALPYLLAAGVAVTWDPTSQATAQKNLRRTLRGLMLENLGVAGICLTVAILSDHVPEPWHLLANAVVGISLVAYSARLTISQHRQHKELHAREDTEKKLRVARDELEASLRSARSRAIELNLLTELGHFLQACSSEDEAYQLIGSALKQILPECSGTLYAIKGADKRAEAIRDWGVVPPTLMSFEGRSCWAVRRHRLHTGSELGPVACTHLEEGEARVSLCVPLLASGEVSGILVLVGNPEYRSQSESELRRIFTRARRVGQAVAEQTGLTLTNLRLRAAMQEQAIRDPLTGLYNRRHMEAMVTHELARAERQGRPLSVLMLDLDHFKRLNDTFGHDAGDAVLRALGAYLRSRVRSADVACRFGGEEFVILMPEAQLADAARRAQDICDGVRELRVKHQGRQLGVLTVSIGATTLVEGMRTGPNLLQAADAALYHAKHAGRNCVALSENGQFSIRDKHANTAARPASTSV